MRGSRISDAVRLSGPLFTRSPLRVVAGAALIVGAFVLFQLDPCDAAQYPQSATSPYLLPWLSGPRRVHQGNCSQSNTHDQAHNASFAYDFEMPVGSVVVAARAGVVLSAEERWPDSDHDEAHGNRVVVDHGDGSYAIYGHLSQGGALVGVGDHVTQRQEIARSGSSGLAATPHLHFMVFSCPLTLAGRRFFCASEPITFRDEPVAPLHEGTWVEPG